MCIFYCAHENLITWLNSEIIGKYWKLWNYVFISMSQHRYNQPQLLWLAMSRMWNIPQKWVWVACNNIFIANIWVNLWKFFMMLQYKKLGSALTSRHFYGNAPLYTSTNLHKHHSAQALAYTSTTLHKHPLHKHHPAWAPLCTSTTLHKHSST